jgi:hypothetical protein
MGATPALLAVLLLGLNLPEQSWSQVNRASRTPAPQAGSTVEAEPFHAILRLAREANISPNQAEPIHVQLLILDQFQALVQLHGRTNRVLYRPLAGQSLELFLYDAAGRPVPKTKLGQRLGAPLQVDLELIDPKHHVILNRIRDERTIDFARGGWDVSLGRYDVRNHFKIRSPGAYFLFAQARFFEQTTADNLGMGVQSHPGSIHAAFQPVFFNSAVVRIVVGEKDLVKAFDWAVVIAWLSAGITLMVAFYLVGKKWRRNQDNKMS